MPKKNSIVITGAKANNLQNIDIEIPYNNLVVVTGVSGSGKSSLTIDTVYAEGQRRYVESLSSYARQFLMRMKKPEVDNIQGLCPAIAIEQKVGVKNARSTVGTLTEIYDFLRILYARIGKTISPVSGNEVKKHSVTDVVNHCKTMAEGTKLMILAPYAFKKDVPLNKTFDLLVQKGFTRVFIDNKLQFIEDLNFDEKKEIKTIDLLIDRIKSTKDNEENDQRIADSVLTAFNEGQGMCKLLDDKDNIFNFSNRFELDGILFDEPNPQLFNFNSSLGACESCEGYGQSLGVDEDKVVPNKKLSIYEEAISCWKGEKLSRWRQNLLNAAHRLNFPVHCPYKDLSKAHKELVWNGCELFRGIYDFFSELEEKSYKIQNRVLLARYRGKTICNKCKGSRLKKSALHVQVGGKRIDELVNMPVKDLAVFFNNIDLSEKEMEIASRLLYEIRSRLEFMINVGLDYLNINRISYTLSGGEIQRIHLTRTLGSNLTSSLYVLDEPSIGLHPRDTEKLIKVLKNLRDLGNTVLVVEHEEDIIANSDYLIDIGPKAGIHGGNVVFSGPFDDIYKKAPDCLTAKYMNGSMKIPVPPNRRSFAHSIWIKGAAQHNLKNIDVQIPLNTLIAISGVSGSGKTTLIKKILYPALLIKMGEGQEKPGLHEKIEGDLDRVTQVEMVNQQPIGKSSRSNPVTYVKAYDAIRKLLSDQQASKIKGFKPKHFSFNVEGGRCETCKGAGETIVSMQFLADVKLTCEDCDGKRFQKEVLEVYYKGKNVNEILELTVDESLVFFSDESDIIQKIKPLSDVGLGYIALGQSSSTLSGGEAQRVKLASFLALENRSDNILFIFDEPSTGLHFHDIQKLLDAFNALIDNGHTVIVVEHNLEIIKSADHIIDLGPEGGIEGGHVLFQGRPEDLIKVENSYTAKHLKEKLK